MNKTLALALAIVSLALPAAAHGDDRREDHRLDRREDRPDRCDDHHSDSRADDVRFERDDARDRDRGGPAGRAVDVEATIRQGVQSGHLTRREAEGLRAQLRDVEALQRRALRNGRLSHGEAKHLARAEDRLASTLRRQLFDDDRRGDDRGGRHDGERGFEPRGPAIPAVYVAQR